MMWFSRWTVIGLQAYAAPSNRSNLFSQQQQRRSLVNGRSAPTTPSPVDTQVLPVNAAGMSCEDSPMVEQSGTKCSLLAKNFGPLGCDRVLSELAAERGRSLENIPTAFRNRRVADACPQSCGLCAPCAPGCAKWFIGNGWCEPACNNAACQFDGGDCWEKDCVVSPWSEWSECSKQCSSNGGAPSYEKRVREILIDPTPGGKPCPKDMEEKRYGCNEDIKCPSDCEVTPWGPWGECNANCGPGERSRSRTIVAEAEAGGEPCPPLSQTQPCFEKECDAECQVFEWSDWSICTQPCGSSGVQIRTRHIMTAPSDTTRECPNLVEERPCDPVPPDCSSAGQCQVSAWSEWSECSTTCGEGGVITRERVLISTQYENGEKLECSNDIPLTEERSCNSHPCPRDCETSDWSDWSDCQSSCGDGVQSRTRRILIEPTIGGRVCGPLSETRSCFNDPCPQDCAVSDWTGWSPCRRPDNECGAGVQVHERRVITFPTEQGAPCPRLSDFRDCVVPCPSENSPKESTDETRALNSTMSGAATPIPSVCTHLSDQWSEWSSCDEACHTDSATQVKQRHRLIGQWSPSCDEVVQEFECDCSKTEKSGCILSEWSRWSSCSIPCGGIGTRKRYRSIVSGASDTQQCPHALEETEVCGTSPCSTSTGDCDLSPWSPWSECSSSCGVGTTIRTRYHLGSDSSISSAKGCDGVLEQVAACASSECDSDCEVSDWSLWSECSSRCGGGFKERIRRVLHKNTGLGKICPHLKEREDCSMQACDADCVLTDWSEWSPCSGDCGPKGSQTRHREVLRPQVGRGAPCSRKLIESQSCNHDCTSHELLEYQSRANCDFTEWSDWSACEGTCQEGITRRTRSVKSNTDPICIPLEQTAPCQLPACRRDCEVSAWDDWSECSVQCGGGERFRSRAIVIAPSSNGAPCPTLWESEMCNTDSCRGDDCMLGAWTDWTACSQSCGGGVKSRTRDIVQPPTNGGEPCGETKEIRGCNLQRCAHQQCMDNPLIESNGISCGMLKTQGCLTNLIELAKKHDVALSTDTIPPEARIQDACPETCGVCEECAPGCQLRDLGNTVCSEECNNEACQFDLGDCGADCSLASLKGIGMTTTSVATALRIGDSITLSCPPGLTLLNHSDLSEVIVQCSPDKDLIVPDLAGAYAEELQCVEDLCPKMKVSSESLPLFNGIYNKISGSHYRKQVGLTYLNLRNLSESPQSSRWVLTYPKDDAMNTLVEVISAPCPPNHAAPDCHKGVWYESTISRSVFADRNSDVDQILGDQLGNPINLKCTSDSAPHAAQPTLKTSLKTGPKTSMPMPCEDVKLVQQIAGFSCTQLVDSLGCGYLLADAGRELPPMIPKETTVGFVCPATCGLCNSPGCAPGCVDWFLSNTVCDSACDVAECAFDGGDCSDNQEAGDDGADRALSAARELDQQSTAVASVTTTGAYQATRGVDEENCDDDSMVSDMGFSCSLLFMASQLKGGCTQTILGLAQSQGLTISLPAGVPADTRVLDACPKTCGACNEERYLKPAAASFALQDVDYSETGCSDNDSLVSSYASMTCGEIAHILPDCSLSVASLGYLPEGTPESLTIETLCPLSCKACKNARAPKYECHDFSVLQTLSGFSCAQAVGLLGKSTCSRKVSSFGYELPAALPSTLVLSDLCGESCATCQSSSGHNGDDDASADTTTSGGNCVDDALVYDITGHECHEFTALKGVRCGDKFSALGYALPSTIPSTATVAQACPVSCATCRHTEAVECADSDLVSGTLKTTCDALMSIGTCAKLISDISTSYASALGSLGTQSTIGDLCRKSCGRCANRESDVCEDHTGIANAGFACSNIVRYAESGCTTPLANVFGRHLIPVPDITIVSDACPKTCRLCIDPTSELKAIEPVCEDSSLLTAVNFECSQILQLAGGDGIGCTANLSDLAGSTSFGAMLPTNLVVKDLCKKTCRQCGVYSCLDGFQNGFEEYIDCGGKDCRVCGACQLSDLKNLGDHLIAVGTRETGGNTFDHGSTRELMCDEGYHYTSTNTKISCLDGKWTDPKGKCSEDTIEVWRATIGLTHAEDFMHDFVQNLAEALEVLFSLVTDSIDGDSVRILKAGACTAMSSSSSGADDCEDNALVESMGFGCSMLAGFGCSNGIAALAATAGVSVPAGIPSDALVSDACPKTCDACEAAAERMAQYLAQSSSGPLGTDCFKADFAVDTNMNLPILLNATLGRLENIERVLLAAIKDSVTTHNTTLMTKWTITTSGSSEQRSLMKAVDFINSRPVSLFLTAPSSDDSSSMSLDSSASSSSSASARALAPFELANVTKSTWAKGAGVSGGIELSRGVFVSSGLSPSFAFLDPTKIISSIYPPLDDRLTVEEQIGDIEALSSWSGRLYKSSSTTGTVLEAGVIMNVASCSIQSDDYSEVDSSAFTTEGTDVSDCCALRAEFITYLQSDCGLWLMGEQMTPFELQHLCLVASAYNELETGSCYARLKRMLHKYRQQGDPTCGAAELLNDVLDSWCAKNPAGEFCMINFLEDMKSFSISEFSLKLSDELDEICAEDSCARNHVRYLRSIIHLNVAWGIQTYLRSSGKSNARRILMHISDWNTELAGMGYRLKDDWLMNLRDASQHKAASPSFDERAEALRRLQETLQMDESNVTSRRQLSSSDDSTSSDSLLPLAGAAEDILALVCYKPLGAYCQHTLQLLSNSINPVENLVSDNIPCSSACFSPMMTKLGVILEKQGRAIGFPRHAVLGAALSSFGKHGCSQLGASSQSLTANKARCYETYAIPETFTPESMVVDRGEPSYDAKTCRCSALFLGDGTCDPTCFTPACAYDGGDCFTESMFPTYLASLLGAVCASSINDPCLPINKNFRCTDECKARIQNCISTNGCCYAGAIESLKNIVNAENYVHEQAFNLQQRNTPTATTNPLFSNSFSSKKQATTFTPQYNSGWSMPWLEQSCGITLDRACANGGNVNEFSLLAEYLHVSTTGQTQSEGQRRRLQQSSTEEIVASTGVESLDTQVALAIESINIWLRSASARLKLAEIFNIVPDDIYSVWLQPLAQDAAAFVLNLKPGNDYSAVTTIREFTIDQAASVLNRFLVEAPGVNDLRNSESIALSRFGYSDRVVVSEKAGRTSTARNLLGVWGFDDDVTLLQAGECTLTDLYKILGESQSATFNVKSSYAHGEQVSTNCSTGYSPIVDDVTSGIWQCVSSNWIATNSRFQCDLPCPNDVLSALGLFRDAVALQPVANNPDVALITFPPWATLRTASSRSFMPGDAVILSCTQGRTVDISTGRSGVVGSLCKGGEWSSVLLDCQPACSAVPPFATTVAGAYTLTGTDSVYGGARNVSCASGYFANPPTFEGRSEIIKCGVDGVWAQPSFKCVLGITVDPSGNASTVQKMLKTLFSRTGIISLAAFGSVAVIAVITITLLWIFVYKRKADKAYLERKKLLQEYLSSAMTSSGAGDTMPMDGAGGGVENQNRPLREQGGGHPLGWEGRSPSSSTVSAFRRISMLRTDR